MKIKKIIYKGITFDHFLAYGEGGVCGEVLGAGPSIVDERKLRFFGMTACPWCIKKYGLYEDTGRTPEDIEREIKLYDGENVEEINESPCCVEGCKNGISYDIIDVPVSDVDVVIKLS